MASMWSLIRRPVGRLILLAALAACLVGLLAASGAAPRAAVAEPVAAAGAAAAAGGDELDPKYKDWLDEVAPLISARERQVFLALGRDYQRDDFIERFWAVRDPFPQTPQNELRDAWEPRAKLARERYGNVTEDRARVLLIHGEPSHVFRSRCSETVLPLEIWSYEHTQYIRHGYAVVFVQDQGAARGRYRLWAPSEGLATLLTLAARSRHPTTDDASALEGCSEAGDIAGYLSEAIDERQVETRGKILPRPSEEWLSGFAAATTDVPTGAEALAADLEVSFPGHSGSRTVMQGLVRIRRDAARPQVLDNHSFYSFVVDGEVLRKDELFEHFRYRFNFPERPAGAPVAAATATPGTGAGGAMPGTSGTSPTAAISATSATAAAAGSPQTAAAVAPSAEIPLVFQRYLRPGAYSLVIRVEDTGGKRYFRAERDLEVPAVTEAPETLQAAAAAPADTGPAGAGAAAAGQTAAAAPGAAGAAAPAATPGSIAGHPAHATAAGAALAEANATLRAAEQTVRLLPIPEGLLIGSLRVDAQVDGSGIDHVRFLLDGRPMLSKRRPPFSVDLNLGPQPRAHIVRVVAETADGRLLAEDQVVLNAGPHRFAVRLLEPQAGKHYSQSLRAEAKLEVPEGEKLDRLEIYSNDTLVATLYQPPWTQPLLVPETGKLSFVRAVAYLEDGNSTEDLVLVNSPNPGERIDVQMVELYTTVTDHRGRPVEGLARDDFKVFEDGSEETLRRFERVQDLPIYAGVLLDTSGSMADQLDTAVEAALRFFQTVIQTKDRASVITFNGQPNLAVRFTNDHEVLAGGLAGLHADGNTALYDSIIYALYYFGGVRGKRAIVLLTDGKDEGSKFHYTDALEYAKHSGIAFYTIGLGQTAKEPDIRMKLQQLAAETGGRSFSIDRVSELAGTYRSIEGELRSQYLLAYQSSKQGNDGKFRAVAVKLGRPGLEARTVPGYYP
jgi:VWFA-related protein